MADSLIFGSYDRPIQMPQYCSGCKFPPTSNSEKYIPLHLIYKILTQTPCLRTLDSSKLICRDWNQLLHEPGFVSDNCINTKNVCGFILQGNARWNQEFVSLEDTEMDKLGRNMRRNQIFLISDYEAKILASSRQSGILFVVGYVSWSREQRLYIGKPAVDNWRPLPIPNLCRYYTAAAAVVVLSSKSVTRYKIIRLSHRKLHRSYNLVRRSNIYHCEVFDSRSWRWETLIDIELGFEAYLDASAGEPVTVGMLVHWLTTDHQVLAFNCEDDSYHQFSQPEAGMLNENDWRILVEYEGKLGVMCTNQEERITRVWARMDGIWSMVMEVELEPLQKPVGLYNREIVVLTTPEKIEFYNVRHSRTIRSLETDQTGGSELKIFPFRSDCEEVDLSQFPCKVRTGWPVL